MKDAVKSLISGKAGSPFLFVGSGFSRRYIGLEDWDSLLRKFCDGLKDYEYYRATANNALPQIASLIAQDFHTLWWSEDRFSNSRANFKDLIYNDESALKLEICLYMQNIDLEVRGDEALEKEIEVLKTVNVDGIITTNWDNLIEEIFPEYRVFVGQEELLFSNPQSIAEIYKIHGSCENHESLILTSKDYAEFSKKNPYLAAKLITIFIENPIFFIGYSVHDPHVSDIIFSIASCLGDDKIEQFANNLIFLRRASGAPDSVQKFTFNRDGKNITATVLETDDFAQVYEAIAEQKRKIPARILRYCKEQMFELVKTNDPETKLAVIDIDDIDKKEEVEFVVGVGVASAASQSAYSSDAPEFADSGYSGVERSDLLRDAVSEKSKYEAEKVLKSVFPKLRRSGVKFHPIFRYLRAAGIDSEAKLRESEFGDAAALFDKIKSASYQYKSTYRASFYKNYDGMSAQEILDKVGYEKSAIYLAYIPKENIDFDWLRVYLEENFDKDFRDPYESAFKKLICHYDRMRYGFEPAAENDVVAKLIS